MPSAEDIKKSVEELKKIVQRDLPADDRGVLQGVIDSLEEFLKIPYDEDETHKKKQHYHAVYRRKIPGRGR